jgi:hypothetical protein
MFSPGRRIPVLEFSPYQFLEMMHVNMVYLNIDTFDFSIDMNALARLALPEITVSVTLTMIINSTRFCL